MFVPRRNALLLVLCFIFLSGFQFAKTFNLETRIPVIKTGNSGSYFGYSVAEHLTYETDDEPPISWYVKRTNLNFRGYNQETFDTWVTNPQATGEQNNTYASTNKMHSVKPLITDFR